MSLRVAVVGGGAVGSACARALAERGARVRILDAGHGRAAGSWAAAGLLTAARPHLLPEAVHALAARSLELWQEVAARRPEVELRLVGLLLLGDDPDWLAFRAARGLSSESASWHGTPAHRFPEVEVVRSSRAAAALRDGLPVERAEVVDLASLRREVDLVVLAAGAWSSPLLAAAGLDLAVRPRRGQMLRFAAGRLSTALVVAGGDELAVPRADGSVVVGTTLEDVGFDPRTVPDDLARLEAWARAAIPGLGRRVDTWAGLRPCAAGAAPTVGWAAPDVMVAVGHHRNGLLLAPATAELVADLALGRPPQVPADALAPAARAQASSSTST